MPSSSRPRPYLPLEVKGHILQFCDAPTLAASSQVSLALLELAGPLLYRDLEIRGIHQLRKLVRSETGSSSIGPFVSLAQTKTLTYVALDLAADDCDGSARLSSSPVRLDSVVVDMRQADYWAFPDEDEDGDERPDTGILVASTDPLRFHVIGPSPCADGDPSRLPCEFEFPSPFRWTRIREITFKHAYNHDDLDAPRFAVDTPIDLAFDLTSASVLPLPLSTLWEEFECNLHHLRVGLTYDWHGHAWSPPGPSYGRIELLVNNQAEVDLAKQMLVMIDCTLLDVRVQQPTDA